MSERGGCSLYVVGLAVAVALTFYFFGRLLTADEFNPEQGYTRQTVTAIVATNQAVGTFIAQTQAANISECLCQTITPEATATPTITPTTEMRTFTPTPSS